MARLTIRRSGPRPGETDSTLATRAGLLYQDFEIRSRRLDADRVELSVAASPFGKTTEPCVVRASKDTLRALSVPFQAPLEEAAEIGRRLARILLPEPVYRLLQNSIRRLDASRGLRIRLALDPSLMDLPWEFTFRPEAPRGSDLPGFLFLDPKLSLVRGAARARTRVQPSSRPQRLLFLGTFWSGGQDMWRVEEEFNKLALATRPIGSFLSMDFVDVVDSRAVNAHLERGASFFHYSGHTDASPQGHYLVREGSATGGSMPWYAREFAPALAAAGTRLGVFSACNSGAWEFVEPLLRSGVPAVIGVHGAIESQSATHFCEKLYAALAVGLSLDEAVAYARMRVVHLGTLPCDWGRPMVYLTTKEAVLFPRPDSATVRKHQDSVRVEGGATIQTIRERFASSDDRGAIGRFISETAERQVLILGRFKAARKAVLEALRSRLFELDRGYMPCVFDFEVPEGRRLGESALLLAGLSRFVIADLTDPSSVPAELEKMITQFPSVPVQPILLRGMKPYALFEDHVGKPNVLEIVYYKDQDDLLSKLEGEILTPAEIKAAVLRKSPSRGPS